MLKRFVCMVIAAVMCCGMLGGCQKEEDAVITRVEKTAFSVPGVVTGELNPFFAEQAGDRSILSLIVEHFVSDKGVATFTDEITEDGMLKVTVSVSQSIQCSDKTGLFAVDFMYAVQLVCDPTYDGPYTELAKSSLVGLADFRSGQSKSIEGLHKVNSYTCTLLFSDVEEDYLSLLDLPAVRTHNYGEYEYGKCSWNDITYKYVPVVATDVMCIDNNVPLDGKMVNLKYNERYHGTVVKGAKCTVRYVRDEDVALNLRLGQLTYGFMFDKSLAKSEAEKYGFTIVLLADCALLSRKAVTGISETHTINDALSILATKIA